MITLYPLDVLFPREDCPIAIFLSPDPFKSCSPIAIEAMPKAPVPPVLLPIHIDSVVTD